MKIKTKQYIYIIGENKSVTAAPPSGWFRVRIPNPHHNTHTQFFCVKFLMMKDFSSVIYVLIDALLDLNLSNNAEAFS